MAEINRAYELLSDGARRAALDAGSRTRADHAAAERLMSGRFLKWGALLLALPLLFRTSGALLRALAALFRLLFETAGALRGPRIAAVVVVGALVVLVLATFRRRRG
jgi:curved DNA-binding protein CbpA